MPLILLARLAAWACSKLCYCIAQIRYLKTCPLCLPLHTPGGTWRPGRPRELAVEVFALRSFFKKVLQRSLNRDRLLPPPKPLPNTPSPRARQPRTLASVRSPTARSALSRRALLLPAATFSLPSLLLFRRPTRLSPHPRVVATPRLGSSSPRCSRSPPYLSPRPPPPPALLLPSVPSATLSPPSLLLRREVARAAPARRSGAATARSAPPRRRFIPTRIGLCSSGARARRPLGCGA
jgi:hypothetical protein